ncbi:MAG: hypothetical protein ACE5IY_11260 [bacterium]
MHIPELTRRCWSLIVFSIFVVGIVSPLSVQAQIVVVVPSSSNVDSLVTKDLQQIFKGEVAFKREGVPYQIVEFAPVSDKFYKILYNLDAYSIGKHWLRRIFSGERVLPPKSFSKVDRFEKFLLAHENAIGFMTADAFGKIKRNAVRAVIVNGCHYQQPEYALRKPQREPAPQK